MALLGLVCISFGLLVRMSRTRCSFRHIDYSPRSSSYALHVTAVFSPSYSHLVTFTALLSPSYFHLVTLLVILSSYSLRVTPRYSSLLSPHCSLPVTLWFDSVSTLANLNQSSDLWNRTVQSFSRLSRCLMCICWMSNLWLNNGPLLMSWLMADNHWLCSPLPSTFDWHIYYHW